MKKLLFVIISFVFLTIPVEKAHALDPKGKAFLIICTYGTVGGALLGFATMAFGTNSRAIAQGASLGLYAGIAFGGYVISSHEKPGEMSDPAFGPQGGEDPALKGGFGAEDEAGGGPFGDDGLGGGSSSEEDSGFFGTPQRYIEINEHLMYNYKLKKGRSFTPPIYINFFHKSF